MTAPITIAGGVYQERCIWPDWDQVMGSGGRAAVAISGTLVPEASLTSYATGSVAARYARSASVYGVRFEALATDQEISFDYVHPMAQPAIRPSQARIARKAPLAVASRAVLRFGMLETSAVVDADRCVYDPQSAFEPEPFAANGSRAARLAVVGNRAEIARLGGDSDPLAAARELVGNGTAEVVIVKAGALGAFVVEAGGVAEVPAYRSGRVWTIGSGDVFAAVFAACWGVREMAAPDAADLASRAVAEYADSMALPVRTAEDLRGATHAPVQASRGLVYLAAPFFTVPQRWFVDEARRHLRELGQDVFSPVHDVGPGPAEVVAPADIDGIVRCDAMFAILDGLDPGTIFEIGYARALGKPVHVLAQQVGEEDLKMISGSGCTIHVDFVTALHHVAWRA